MRIVFASACSSSSSSVIAPGGGAVEIAGRFVGQQQRRLADQGAGDGDALPFAAGEFGGAMVESLRQGRRGRASARRAVRRCAWRRRRRGTGRARFPAPCTAAAGGGLETRSRSAGCGSGRARLRRARMGPGPSRRTRPEVGGSSVPRIESSVLLPEPLGPRMARFSPRLQCRATRRSSTRSGSPGVGNSLTMCSTTRSASEVGTAAMSLLSAEAAIRAIVGGNEWRAKWQASTAVLKSAEVT